MLVIKLRSKYIGKDRIEETVFIGQEGFTLQNAGCIVMSVLADVWCCPASGRGPGQSAQSIGHESVPQ